ncbi:M20 family metallopeptidase [Salinicola rhizosphaerae]|uniref:Aminobenzoyl-glutamate utilization protein B n=1 Tax=Salinicola rhizosphaerae TaxID=1443141 RepID=A0ABQ3E3Z4_9GAMM|nr:M20 family metallopeptidase [Salinicola rhizosphaerae]GHB25597.1 aminobenzoyl-glutamate utilization protein B [Salinicola rhizosphaerae]
MDATVECSSTRRLDALVEAKRERFIDYANQVWEFAETRFVESRSAATLSEALEAEGFRVERGTGGLETAFVASYGNGKPVIALLGEYDALAGLSQRGEASQAEPLIDDGNGHGCGHNLLGVAALAGAVGVRDYMDENALPGTVRFYGCPGEEGGSGKTFMVREGVFDDVDAALTWHPQAFNAIFSTPTLANIQAYFRFKGTSAHAANSPHLGRSALDAVELMNVGANYLREHIVPDARLHYSITRTGGASPNVVQADAEVLYLMRARRMSDAQAIFERIQKIAEGAALMTGTEVEMTFDKACSGYRPNRTLERLMYSQFEAFGPPCHDAEEKTYGERIKATVSDDDLRTTYANIIAAGGEAADAYVAGLADKALTDDLAPYSASEELMYGSTDVGDVSWVVPTAQCYVSCFALGTPLHTWQVVAQGRSSLGHKGMLQAAKVMAGTAVALLENPETVEAAREELNAATSREPYRCPIPDGVTPSPLRA